MLVVGRDEDVKHEVDQFVEASYSVWLLFPWNHCCIHK